MFIHLDVGWMSHPFPLSSFRISDPEQITILQGLGLERVRWSPEKSESGPVPLDEAPAAAGSASGAPAVAAPDPVAAGAEARRRALAEQRSALKQCERQYAEASRAWREALALVTRQPEAARERVQAVTQALLDKMLSADEMCIRLLSESAGDRATAHSMNVSVMSMLMGKLFGLAEAEMLDLGMGALLHDVGKLELPPRVRHPDEGFTTAETNFYRSHVQFGVTQGRKMGLTPGVLLVIAQHHEHADGTGFPQRLNADRMTPAARIVALINRYDNLCNPPVVTQAMTPHETLSLMFSQGKHKFDATMLNAFIRMMGVYPPGSVVQLTDERYALVVSVNSSRPLKPRVLVHDPGVPRDEALYVDLERRPTLGIRRSLKVSQLPSAALQYLSPRPQITYFFEAATVAEPEFSAAPPPTDRAEAAA